MTEEEEEPQLRIKNVSIQGIGLVNGKYEYAPFMEAWPTWGKHSSTVSYFKITGKEYIDVKKRVTSKEYNEFMQSCNYNEKEEEEEKKHKKHKKKEIVRKDVSLLQDNIARLECHICENDKSLCNGCSECKTSTRILPKEIISYELDKSHDFTSIPTLENLSGDENIWFKLYVHTNSSCVESLDQYEEGQTKRKIQAGMTRIGLRDIFNCAKQQQIGSNKNHSVLHISSIFMDPILFKTKMEDLTIKYFKENKQQQGRESIEISEKEYESMQKESLEYSTKATVDFQFEVKNFTNHFIESSVLRIQKLDQSIRSLSFNNKESGGYDKNDILSIYIDAILNNKPIDKQVYSKLADSYFIGCPQHMMIYRGGGGGGGNRQHRHKGGKTRDFYYDKTMIEGKEEKEETLCQQQQPPSIMYNSPLHITIAQNVFPTLVSNYVSNLITSITPEDQKNLNNNMKMKIGKFECDEAKKKKNQMLMDKRQENVNDEDEDGDGEDYNKKIMAKFPPRLLPSSSSVEHLHIAYHKTEQGDMPTIGYYLHSHKGFGKKSESFFLNIFKASLTRHGLNEKSFLDITRRQMAEETDIIHRGYFLCVEAVVTMGTFCATQGLYTADIRYANASITNKVHTKILTDSWDRDILYGFSNSSDCEDFDNVGASIIRDIEEGLYHKDGSETEYIVQSSLMRNPWHNESLAMAQYILSRRTTFDVAATVTEAFVDANKQPMKGKDMIDLPVVNDEVDKRSPIGGHAHSLSYPNCIVAATIRNSNLTETEKQVISQTVNNEFIQFMDPKSYKPWEYRQSILCLEGTGLTTPYLIPDEEVFVGQGKELKKIRGSRDFYRSIALDPSFEFLRKKFTAEAQSFYFEKPKENRRISTFYREGVHGYASRLYKIMGPAFSHITFCYKDSNKYGVNIADLIRDIRSEKNISKSNVSFSLPYIPPDSSSKPSIIASKYISSWNNGIEPMMQSMLRQQPLSMVGHFDESKIYSRIRSFDSLLHSFSIASTTDEMILNGGSPTNSGSSTPLPDITFKYTKPPIPFEKLIGEVAKSDYLTTVRYYSKGWQFTGMKDDEKIRLSEQFKSFISHRSIMSYQLSEEKYFPQCDGTIQLTLIIDITKVDNNNNNK